MSIAKKVIKRYGMKAIHTDKSTMHHDNAIVSWDTYQIAKDAAAYMVESGDYDDEDAAFSAACQDADITEIAWEDTLEYLDELMRVLNPSKLAWTAGVENFGWRGQSGSTTFPAANAKDLLRHVLPPTDCVFYGFIYQPPAPVGLGRKQRPHLWIQNYHHDSCVGREWYKLVPTRT